MINMLIGTSYHAIPLMPLSQQDRKVLDEMFANFDDHQLNQLDALACDLLVPCFDPSEESAWIRGSSGSVGSTKPVALLASASSDNF